MISQLLKHEQEIMDLLKALVDGCRNERGYSATGRLLTLILQALTNVYVMEHRCLNPDEWSNPGERDAFLENHSITMD